MRKLAKLKIEFEPLAKLEKVLGDRIEKVFVSDRIAESNVFSHNVRVLLVCQYEAHYDSTGAARQLVDFLNCSGCGVSVAIDNAGFAPSSVIMFEETVIYEFHSGDSLVCKTDGARASRQRVVLLSMSR